jgi:carboxypeptidase Taq
LGNLYAAQLFTAFQQSNPHWQEKVAAGDLSSIREWLNQHIHKFGRQYLPEELIQRATGKPLSEEPYLHYLENKYNALYR